MKTSEIIKDLESLATCGLRISVNTQGRNSVPWTTMMASIIFSRIVLNSTSVLRLTPGSSVCQPVGTFEIWDLPSVASLSRNLVEAYFALHYILLPLPDEDAKLRELVWRYHETSERKKMLREALPQSAGVPVLQEKAAKLRETIGLCQTFQMLPRDRQRRILNGEVAKLRTNEELCAAAGVDAGYYNSMFKYGSNHTHSSPFCFAEMDRFSFDEERKREEGILWTATQTCAGFLALAILDFLKVFPDQDPSVNAEERFRLSFWEQVVKRGPASLAPQEER